MDLNAQKEQFSRAYVQAVAAVAGYSWSVPSVDDDSIDLTLAARGGGGTIRSPKLDLQLKCTAADVPREPTFRYDIKVKNHRELIVDTVLVPRILVVVLVPEDIAEWLSCTTTELTLKHSGYWVSLRGQPPTTNTSTVSVSFSLDQPFDPEQLRGMMNRIGSGELP